MEKALLHFLGNIDRSIKAQGFYVALNSYASNQDFEDWHSHRNASISFLLSGTYHEAICGKNYRRQTGDIKFIPAGELHRCDHYTNDARKINIDLSEQLLRKMGVVPDQISSLFGCFLQSKFTLLKFYHELDDNTNSVQASVQLLLYELLHPPRYGWKPVVRQAPPWVRQLKDLLHDEYHGPFELNKLAHTLDVHPVTISRYFPHYFGMTLSQYIRNLKVEKALSLIKKTSLSLTEIAFACGFADQPHFIHTFKRLTGYLPKEFRQL